MTHRVRRSACLATAVIALLCIAISACATGASSDPYAFETAQLYGMIYGQDNEPVSGALLLVNGEPGPTSDLEGRFVLPDLARGDHVVSISKNGYEPTEVSFQFLNQTQVLYLRMRSIDDIIRTAEQAVRESQLDRAAELIDRALEVDPHHADARFLLAALMMRQSLFVRAEEILLSLLEDGTSAPEVRIALADLYQYGLGDAERAAAQLRNVFSQRPSDELQERIDALVPGGE